MSKGKQGGLTHIGELLPGLVGFDQLKATKTLEGTKAVTVQGRHHFTRIKQIDALAGIGDDPNADMGFVGRLLTLCSLLMARVFATNPQLLNSITS